MQYRMRLMLALLMSVVTCGLLTACGGAPTAPTLSPTTTNPDDTTRALAHASAPAGNDFREDSPLLVAATGKPQLLEVFSYD